MEPRRRHVANDLGEDREVPGDSGLFGRGRPAAEPEDRRDEAVIRLRAIGLGRVFGVVDERQPERPRIGERAPEQRRGADARSVVGEADDTRIRQLAQRCQCLAATPRGDRPVRQRPHRRTCRAGSGADTGQDRRIVERRRRVRHQADGREAAVSRRRQPRSDRLGVLVAGLPEMGVEVDEARSDDDPVLVDTLGVGAVQPHDQFEDPVSDDDVARPLAARRRVDEPGAADVEVGHSAAARDSGSAVPASR